MDNDSVLDVRLDVDESGVSRLMVGERACVTAEAYGDHKFLGTVIRVRQILGKGNIRTDELSEHEDTKILETLVEVDPGSGCLLASVRTPLSREKHAEVGGKTEGKTPALCAHI